MKVQSSFLIFILVFVFFPASVFSYSGRSDISSDIKCHGVEINGEDSLYVTGELIYYVEEDKKFSATLYFYNIFDEVLARAYIEVTLKQNDDSVLFDAPIFIDDASDPVEVKSAHHIQWKVHYIEKILCCANHGGISGCDEDSGRIKCDDGVISKSCACEDYHMAE